MTETSPGTSLPSDAWRRGLLWATLALGITPLSMVALTVAVERRSFVLGDQYAAFIIGDVLLALAVGVGASVNHPVRSPQWVLVTTALGALAVGAVQLRQEVHAGTYVLGEALSPTKLWHQFVVYPVLSVLLIASLSRAWGRPWRIGSMLVLFAVWIGCLVWDQSHSKSPHCSFDWSHFACEQPST